MTGIYSITDKINGKMYIGYCKKFSNRKGQHFRHLRNNTHPNEYLQNAYNKHGEINIVFEIIEECEERFLYALEHYWVTILNTLNRDFGYNLKPTDPNKLSGGKLKEIGRAHV